MGGEGAGTENGGGHLYRVSDTSDAVPQVF